MILDQFKLDGKTAIVTGASRGLGEAMALGLAEAGADIVLVGRSDLKAVQKKIEKLGRRVVCVNADLAKMPAIDQVMKAFRIL